MDTPLHRPAQEEGEGRSMFAILSWIVFGLVIGIIAKLLMPGRDPGGFIVTILLGVAGALLGGFLGRALGWRPAGGAAGVPAGRLPRSRAGVVPRRGGGRLPDVAHRRRGPAGHLQDGDRQPGPRLSHGSG